MKVLRIVFALGMGALGGMLLAQSETDFSGWMKQVAATSGKAKGDVAAKDAKAISADAKTFEGLFKQVEAYFTSKNMADAAGMAKSAHMAANAAAKAADAGNVDAAVTSMGMVTGACQGCHMAHREKGPDGAYKMK
jgi:hypothetical protein